MLNFIDGTGGCNFVIAIPSPVLTDNTISPFTASAIAFNGVLS
ncbi:MAG: hypothetical protein V7K25_20690 [Nostoc sp.]